MATNSQSSGPAVPSAGRAGFGQVIATASASAMSMKWSALLDAGDLVCTLAGLSPEPRKPDVRNFPAIMKDTGGWRARLAQDGVNDLAAIMEPGMTALLAARAHGADPAPAALALWHEFQAARAALLALVPPLGIKRRA